MRDSANRNTAQRKRFVLMDRDGVINRRIEGGYASSWQQFIFLPRALEALRLLADNGYEVLVVSNQACVGKGLLSWNQLMLLTRRFMKEVADAGGNITDVYYCPHMVEARCDCRKPQPGLLQRAQREHGFDFETTFMVGDSETDLEAARKVNAPGILVLSPFDRESHSFEQCASVVNDLYDAAEFILGADAVGVGSYNGRRTGTGASTRKPAR